jgi:hypothetical protein
MKAIRIPPLIIIRERKMPSRFTETIITVFQDVIPAFSKT